MGNSLFLASAATVLGTLFCSMGGYALAKYRFRGRAFLASRHAYSTSRSAPTKRTTRPWMIRVRFPASSGWKTDGSRFRVDVPVSSAPKSIAEKKIPTGLFLPRSATAIPMNPTWTLWITVRSTLNCQPRRSIAPAMPAKAPEIAIARK